MTRIEKRTAEMFFQMNDFFIMVSLQWHTLVLREQRPKPAWLGRPTSSILDRERLSVCSPIPSHKTTQH